MNTKRREGSSPPVLLVCRGQMAHYIGDMEIPPSMNTSNPLLADWTAPFGAAAVRPHQAGAFRSRPSSGARGAPGEIAAIAGRPGGADFRQHHRGAGALRPPLDRVRRVFYRLAGAHTNEAIQAIEREIAPLLARHWNEIYLERGAVPPASTRCSPRRDKLGLDARAGARAGALPRPFRARGARLDAGGEGAAGRDHPSASRRSARTFSQNVLADEQCLRARARREDDLAGLPDFVRAAARAAAEERGLTGQHVITLVALQRRAVPALLGAARPAREGLPRLGRARR